MDTTTTPALTVISMQEATGPSPLTGAPIRYSTVLHQMMSDGSERFACNHPARSLNCGFTAGTVRSVISHQRIHGTHSTALPVDGRTRRLVAKARQAVRETQTLAEAAQRLNNAGVRTIRGDEWIATNLSKVLGKAARRHDADRAHARQTATAATPPQAASHNPVQQTLIDLRALLEQALRGIDALAAQGLGDAWELQELRGKAARFDAIQTAMGAKP